MIFFFSSRRRHTRYWRDWSSDVCSSDLDNSKDIDLASYFLKRLEIFLILAEHVSYIFCSSSVRSTFRGIIIGLASLRSFTASLDRKSTRLNSSHANISYAVFCLKKKKELLRT